MHTLILVYNADSGKFNTALDMAHKLLSPATYSCNLCALTHGVFTEREAWKQFRARTDDTLIFLHKDEFERLHGTGQGPYPVVLEQRPDGTLHPWLTADEIRKLPDLDALIAALVRQHD